MNILKRVTKLPTGCLDLEIEQAGKNYEIQLTKADVEFLMQSINAPGRARILTPLQYTTAEAADLLGRSQIWVKKKCLEHEIGRVANSPGRGVRDLSAAALDELRGLVVEGTRRGRPRKKG